MAVEPITGLTYQEIGMLQTDVLQNEQLNYVGAWLNCVVLSVGDTAPPGSPAEGDRYIVGTSATGAWATHDDALAVYRGGWQFYAPSEGVAVKDLYSGDDYEFVSGTWSVKSGGGGGGGGGGDFERIAQVIVTGSAVTDIDFSSLDLDADCFYRLEAFVVPGATGAHVVSLLFNGDTTNGNYQRQCLTYFGTTSDISRTSHPYIFYTDTLGGTGNPYSFSTTVKKRAGVKPTTETSSAATLDASGNIAITSSVSIWNSTTNVTAIKLRNLVTSGFGVGTIVRLYRLN